MLKLLHLDLQALPLMCKHSWVGRRPPCGRAFSLCSSSSTFDLQALPLAVLTQQQQQQELPPQNQPPKKQLLGMLVANAPGAIHLRV